jgi:hypothetical protein
MPEKERKIDKPSFFEKVGYNPHEHQWLYHNSNARFRIACCGRRFGKTNMVGHDLAADMFIPDQWYWIVGPKYKTGEKEFRIVHNDLVHKLKMSKYKGFKKSYNVKQGDMRIEMPWNTVLEVCSADNPDSLLGEGLDRVVVSEAAVHMPNIWDQYIEPAISDKLGVADLPSTPRGNNWYKGMFQLGLSPDDPEYESWRFPSWYNTAVYPGGFNLRCPNIRENGQHLPIVKCTCNKEIIRIFNKASRLYFLQEYAAEFTSFEGKIYEEYDETVHVRPITYNPAWTNWLAFDFGFSDPFCCYDIMVDPMDNVYIWREYQVRYKTTYEHAYIIMNRENPPHYHFDNVAADPRGADEIHTLELLMSVGVQATAEITWEQGVEAVRRWLMKQPDGQPKMFIDPSCYNLRRQMENLKTPPIRTQAQQEKNLQRRPGTRMQHDYDDHGPDAVRYFFNEWEVMRTVSLEDLYDSTSFGAKTGEGFFTHKTSLRLDKPIGY